MDNCTLDCIHIIGNFDHQKTCNFVQQQCNQDTLQFIQAYYCYLDESFVLFVIMGVVSLALMYYALNKITEDLLAPCVEEFITKLNISQALAGVTFLAFANGAPDVMTAIVAGTSNSANTVLIPFGSLYGAALFGIAFIFSVVISQSPSKMLKVKKRQSIIPLGFYIGGTLYLMLVSFIYRKMNLIFASIFLLLYIVYILIVLYFERKQKNIKNPSLMQSRENIADQDYQHQKSITQQKDQVRKSMHEQQQKEDIDNRQHPIKFLIHYIDMAWGFVFLYTVPPITKQAWKPVSAVISLILAPFVMAMSYGFASSFQNKLFSCPYIVWILLPSVILLIHTLYCIFKKIQINASVIYSLYAFIIIVCWIAHICAALINFMQLFSLLTHMNSVFLGLTILAWANSIGDYLSITTFAKKGFASTAIAGIFSGQLFNFLLGFGISMFIQSMDGQYPFNIFDIKGSTFDILSDLIIIAVIGMSLIYMIWLFFVILQKKGQFGHFQSKIAKFYYIFFVLAALALSTTTDFFRIVVCDL